VSKRVSNEIEDMAPGVVVILAMAQIKVDEAENLRRYDPKKIATLQANIKKNGLLQPLIVSEIPEEEQNGAGYTHRLRAAYRRREAIATIEGDRGRAPELDSIPVMVIPADVDPMSVNMSENTQREEMDFIARAAASQIRIDAGIAAGKGSRADMVKEIAEDMGKSTGYVTQLLAMLSLRPAIQKRIVDGDLPFRVARSIPGMEEKEQDLFLERYDEAVKGGMSASDAAEVATGKAKRKRKGGQGRKKKADKAEGSAAISSKKAILLLEETEGELLAASRAEGVEPAAYKEAIAIIRVFGKFLAGKMGAQALGKQLTKRMTEE